jgi:hypothetical protein
MIDRHYGHLAHDSHEHAVSLLDALAFERAVDAARTSTETLEKAVREPLSTQRVRQSRRRADAARTPRNCRQFWRQKG